jgi:hypothetical protein
MGAKVTTWHRSTRRGAWKLAILMACKRAGILNEPRAPREGRVALWRTLGLQIVEGHGAVSRSPLAK